MTKNRMVNYLKSRGFYQPEDTAKMLKGNKKKKKRANILAMIEQDDMNSRGA